MYSTRREVDFVTCRNLVVMGSNPTVNKNSKVVVLMKDSSSPTHSYPGVRATVLLAITQRLSKGCSVGVRRSCVDERLIVSDSQLSWGPGYGVVSNYTTTVYHQIDQHFCVTYRQETGGFCRGFLLCVCIK